MGRRKLLPPDIPRCRPATCGDSESCQRAQAIEVDERMVIAMIDASIARDERGQTPAQRCRYWIEALIEAHDEGAQ